MADQHKTRKELCRCASSDTNSNKMTEHIGERKAYNAQVWSVYIYIYESVYSFNIYKKAQTENPVKEGNSFLNFVIHLKGIAYRITYTSIIYIPNCS